MGRLGAVIQQLFFIGLMAFTLVSNAQQPVREVGIAVHINDVTHIYPKEEIVDLELTLHLRWQTSEHADKNRYYRGPAVDDALSKTWWPYYQILHSRGSINSRLKSLTISPDGQADYLEIINVQVETTMDMSRFPFDTHTLRLSIAPFGSSEYKEQYYLLSEKPTIKQESHLTEWQIENPRNQIISSNNEPMYQFAFEYERMTGFYLYKVLMPILIIIGISHAVLWMPEQHAINRLALVMTSMLTIVAFQWAVIQDIPPVSYITLFQAMLLFAYFLIGSKAFLIVIGERWEGRYRYRIMRWARWSYLLMIILGFIIIRYAFF